MIEPWHVKTTITLSGHVDGKWAATRTEHAPMPRRWGQDGKTYRVDLKDSPEEALKAVLEETEELRSV